MAEPTAGVSESLVCVRGARVVLRQIAGERLLVPIRNDVAQMDAIYALAGAGLAVWEALDGQRTLGEVRDLLVRRFEVTAERAWTDLVAFVERLEERGLVERRP